jgi:hypothetical protein
MKLVLLAAGAALATPLSYSTGPAIAAVTATPAAVAEALIAIDRQFAVAAKSKSPADALTPMLAENVVLYAFPVPRQARTRAEAIKVLHEAFTGDEDRLTWTPVRVGISADGTQGFTYGFMDRSTAGKPPFLGKYVAYWVRQPNGWRVAAFKFVPRPEGEVNTAVRPPALPMRIAHLRSSTEQVASYRAELDRTERAFSEKAQVVGLGPAFRIYGAPDAMNVGGAADFTYGNDAIAEAQGGNDSTPSSLTWAPDGVIVSPSGDLGVTYGYLERNGAVPPGKLARIPWFTIWRRASPNEPWRYVAE